MTYRELIRRIESYGPAALDQEAVVYIDEQVEVRMGEMNPIVDTCTVYMDSNYKELPVDDENWLMLCMRDQ